MGIDKKQSAHDLRKAQQSNEVIELYDCIRVRFHAHKNHPRFNCVAQVLLQKQSLPARAGQAARLQVRTARRALEAGEPQL